MGRNRLHLLFAVMCLIWGTTWIAMKAGIAAVPPVFFAGTRFVAAGVALLAILRLRGEPVGVARVDLARFTAVTALMVAFTYALLFWGMRFVDSGLAAILDLSLIPVALLVIGIALGEERFSWSRAAAILLGIGGILILFGPKAISAMRGDAAELWGGIAIAASAIVYSCGSVLARPLLRTYAPMLVSGVTALGGGLALTFGALLLEPGAVAALKGDWGIAAWIGWTFLVLFGSVAAYTIYLRLLRDWGASRAGAYAFVSPTIAVLLGILVLGEEVHPTDAFGMAIMLAAAWLALREEPSSIGRAEPLAILAAKPHRS